jgi:hypothetical protein
MCVATSALDGIVILIFSSPSETAAFWLNFIATPRTERNHESAISSRSWFSKQDWEYSHSCCSRPDRAILSNIPGNMASRLGRVRVQAPKVYRGSDAFIFFPPGGPAFSQRCSSFPRTLDGVQSFPIASLNRFMAKFVPCFLSASNSARIASMFSFNKDRSVKISSSVHLCCFEISEDIV